MNFVFALFLMVGEQPVYVVEGNLTIHECWQQLTEKDTALQQIGLGQDVYLMCRGDRAPETWEK